jgi:hypothetical protein
MTGLILFFPSFSVTPSSRAMPRSPPDEVVSPPLRQPGRLPLWQPAARSYACPSLWLGGRVPAPRAALPPLGPAPLPLAQPYHDGPLLPKVGGLFVILYDRQPSSSSPVSSDGGEVERRPYGPLLVARSLLGRRGQIRAPLQCGRPARLRCRMPSSRHLRDEWSSPPPAAIAASRLHHRPPSRPRSPPARTPSLRALMSRHGDKIGAVPKTSKDLQWRCSTMEPRGSAVLELFFQR